VIRCKQFQCAVPGAFLCASALLSVGSQSVFAADGDNTAGLRLVSLAPALTELVYAAGAGTQLVGTVEYSDYPAAALSVQRIGDAFRVDYETLRRLEPDVILAWGSGNPRAILDKLVHLGYRVIEFEPETLDDIASHVQQIGKIASTSDIADQVAAEFREALSHLQMTYAGKQTLSVFYQISPQPYFTVTRAHVINEAIELCGGDNVFAGLPGIAPAVALESVVRRNPDVIIASTLARDDGWKEPWRRWSVVSAVKNDALYSIDANLMNRSTPRIAAGVEQICRALEAARAAKSVPD
jgi:iron complex transport system substrate-binding protein